MGRLKLYYWIRKKINWDIIIRCDRCFEGVSFCKRYNDPEYYRYLDVIYNYFKINNLLKDELYPDVFEKHEGGNGAYYLDGEKYIFSCPIFLRCYIKRYKNKKLRKFVIILESFVQYNFNNELNGKKLKRYLCELVCMRSQDLEELYNNLALKIIKEMNFSLERNFFL